MKIVTIAWAGFPLRMSRGDVPENRLTCRRKLATGPCNALKRTIDRRVHDRRPLIVFVKGIRRIDMPRLAGAQAGLDRGPFRRRELRPLGSKQTHQLYSDAAFPKCFVVELTDCIE